MSSRLQMLIDLIKFYSKAQTVYTQDSPFIYSFCIDVLESYQHIDISKTKKYRDSLLKNGQLINVSEVGAGSQIHEKSSLRVKQIVSSASSSINKCKLLVSIANWSKTKRILELGTNLGVCTLAWAENGFEVMTVEGNQELYQFAQKAIEPLDNVVCHYSLFEDYLNRNEEMFDLIYVDGDHSYQATINLIQQSKTFLNPNGVIVIDDIKWSDGMKKAWEKAKQDEYFNFHIDLFALGILSWQESLHYPIHKRLIPKKYKPWPYHFFR